MNKDRLELSTKDYHAKNSNNQPSTDTGTLVIDITFTSKYDVPPEHVNQGKQKMKKPFTAAAFALPILLSATVAMAADEPYNPAKDLLRSNNTLVTAQNDAAAVRICELAKSMIDQNYFDGEPRNKGALLGFFYSCSAVSNKFFQEDVDTLVPLTSTEMGISKKDTQKYLRKEFTNHQINVCNAYVRDSLIDILPKTSNNLCNAVGHAAFKNIMK